MEVTTAETEDEAAMLLTVVFEKVGLALVLTPVIKSATSTLVVAPRLVPDFSVYWPGVVPEGVCEGGIVRCCLSVDIDAVC